jgi:malonyl CoA-acyl carrier protein transacylase
MGEAKSELARSLLDLPIQTPLRPYLSSVTGRFETDPEAIRTALIAQLVEPVRWARQIELLLEHGVDVFIECGPKAVLTGLTRRAIGTRPVNVVPSDDGQRPGRWSLAKVAALLQARRAARSAPLLVPEVSASQLPLLIGEAADRLSQEPGFAEFWSRTQPTVAALVEGLWAAERGRTLVPTPVTETPAAPLAAPAPSATPAIAMAPVGDRASRDEVQAFLLEAICKESGYPPEIVGLDADLEADLGIDTVKQAQVLGRVRDRFNLRTEQKLSLRDFPTLRHILNYVDENLAAKAAEPVKLRPKVPVLDLTARRSQRPSPAPLPLPVPAPLTTLPTLNPAPAAAPSIAPSISKNGAATGSIYPLPTPPKRELSAVERVTVLELKGTARSIGRQHGEALRDSILEVLDRYQRFLGDRGDTLLALPGAMDRLRASFDAASLEELAGVAEGVGVPVDYLLAYNLDAALFPALTPGCTQAVRLARHNEGRLLHLVNEDSPLLLHLGGGLPRVVQVRIRTDAPRPSRKVVLFSLAGQIAGPNGVTGDGLTITSTTLLDAPEPEVLPDGSPHPQLVKQILEEADDLETARAKVLRAKRAGRWSVLLSEAETDRAHYLEYDASTVLRDEPVDDRRTTANHALAGPAKGAIAPEHSCLRAQRLEALLGEGTCTPEDAQKALRDRYDLGRHRTVTHPTMNTVRRVDNVMSLVVEPKARRLTVSDRVLAPGTAETEDVAFLTLEYGDRPPPVELEPIHEYSPEGAGIVRTAEVMDRHVVRARELGAPTGEARRYGHGLLIGSGPLAEALLKTLSPQFDSLERVADASAALPLLQNGGAQRYGALGLVLSADPTPAEQATNFAQRREHYLTAPFRALRAFAAEDRPGLIFSVSAGGGLFGFDNAKEGTGESLGVVGMLKAIRHERKDLVIRAFDTSPTDNLEVLARLIERWLGAKGPLEIGLLRGKAFGLCLAPTAAPSPVGGPLPKSWVITGGARGVTAKIALRLAELYRPKLFLLGRQVMPEPGTVARWRHLDAAGLDQERRTLAGPNATPLAFKAVAETIDKVREIDANLRALSATGAHVEYFPVDVADRSALAGVLERIRHKAPIEGLIHGAGVELAKALEKKTDALFEATIQPKVDGLVHLLALTAADPIQQLIGFSSVSGRFGGHGQVDYAAANEAMFGLLAGWRARNPGKKATVLAWPAFDEVGMAARSSSRIFLERAGQAFMSPAEGANHLVRELWAGAPEPEVVIAGELSALDLDGTMVAAAERPGFKELARRASTRPFFPRPLRVHSAERVEEVILDAHQPYLAHHRIGTTPILPAVIGTELLFELAQEGSPASLRDLHIRQPLKLAEGARLPIVVQKDGDRLSLLATVRRPDGVVMEPGRVFFEAFRAEVRAPIRVLASGQGDLLPYPYPAVPDPTPASRLVFHDTCFRTLLGVRPGTHGGTASLLAPDPSALIPGSDPGRWALPAAVLDGCLQAIGLLGRLLYGTFALPAGFGRLDVDPEQLPRAGERLEAAIQFLAHEPTRVVANLSLSGPRGLILSLERYEAKGATT